MSAKQTHSSRILDDVTKAHKLEQDRKREIDQKHKWALGKTEPNPSHSTPRPVQARSKCAYLRHQGAHCASKAAKVSAISLQRELQSCDEYPHAEVCLDNNVKREFARPEPDADICYSFDAPHGPSIGSGILSMALANAVEKYEVKATEKLVKEEYEVIGKEKLDNNDGYTADDDFELI